MPRILVIRLSAMGDVAMTVPVVGELRAKYPDAEITVLTNPLFKPFFRDIKGLRFFTPELENYKGIAGLWRMSGEIWKEYDGFDMVADLHDVLRSKLLRLFFRARGAKIAAVDKGRKGKRRLTRFKNKALAQLKPTVERYADVFRKLGFDLPYLEANIVPLAERDAKPLNERSRNLTGKHDGKWIGVAPFAKHQGKIYPLHLMERVVAGLAEKESIKMFVFGGGPQERIYAEMLEQKFPGRVFSTIGRLKLDEELDVISNLDLMVSMDSSPMHMASLTGTPVVSVWGQTHPFAGFYGFGQDYANAVQLDLWCRPCSVYGNKPCKIGGYPCLNDIAPETIIERVVSVLFP